MTNGTLLAAPAVAVSAWAATTASEPRAQLGPLIILFAGSTAEAGVRDALLELVPGARLSHLASAVGLGEVVAGQRVEPQPRFIGDTVPQRVDDLQERLIAARTALWQSDIDLIYEQIDVHLMLAPDRVDQLPVADATVDAAWRWCNELSAEGLFRLTCWLFPGFELDARHAASAAGTFVVPVDRGAGRLNREQRVELIASCLLDVMTSAVARRTDVPWPEVTTGGIANRRAAGHAPALVAAPGEDTAEEVPEEPVLPLLTVAGADPDRDAVQALAPAGRRDRALYVYPRSLTVGGLEKETFAVSAVAARAVDELVRGVALVDGDPAPVRDELAAVEESLARARAAAQTAARQTAATRAVALAAAFHPRFFRRLGPNDRTRAAREARERFFGPAAPGGAPPGAPAAPAEQAHAGRAAYTTAVTTTARTELLREGPQVWAERLAGGPGGAPLAAQVLRLALDRFPPLRAEREPLVALGDGVLEPLVNGVHYQQPPMLLIGLWLFAAAGTVAELLQQVAVQSRVAHGGLAAALFLALGGLAGEAFRARIRRHREERTLSRPWRLIQAWAKAWLRWACEEAVLAEQRHQLAAALTVVNERLAELRDLRDTLQQEAVRALRRAAGAGWNICLADPAAWEAEVDTALATLPGGELEALWRQAAGASGGAFLVGNKSNRSVINEVARRWAGEQIGALPLPTLPIVGTAELYRRLHDDARGEDWLATVTIAPRKSAFEATAGAAGDCFVPRADGNRTSTWVIYSA